MPSRSRIRERRASKLEYRLATRAQAKDGETSKEQGKVDNQVFEDSKQPVTQVTNGTREEPIDLLSDNSDGDAGNVIVASSDDSAAANSDDDVGSDAPETADPARAGQEVRPRNGRSYFKPWTGKPANGLSPPGATVEAVQYAGRSKMWQEIEQFQKKARNAARSAAWAKTDEERDRFLAIEDKARQVITKLHKSFVAALPPRLKKEKKSPPHKNVSREKPRHRNRRALEIAEEAKLYGDPWIMPKSIRARKDAVLWDGFGRPDEVPELGTPAVVEITSKVQQLLENAAWSFTVKNDQKALAQLGTAYGLELHTWVRRVTSIHKSGSLGAALCRDPTSLIHGEENAIFSDAQWNKVLNCVEHVRHVATRRLPMHTETMLECLGAADHLLDAMQDKEGFSIVNKLHILVYLTQIKLEREISVLQKLPRVAVEDGEDELAAIDDLKAMTLDDRDAILQRLVKQVNSLFAHHDQFQPAGIIC